MLTKLIGMCLVPLLVGATTALQAFFWLLIIFQPAALASALAGVLSVLCAPVAAWCAFTLSVELMEPSPGGVRRFLGVSIRAASFAGAVAFVIALGADMARLRPLSLLVGAAVWLYFFPVFVRAGLDPRGQRRFEPPPGD